MQFENVVGIGFGAKASPEAVERFRAWVAEQGTQWDSHVAAQSEFKGRCALDFETDPPTAKGMPPGVGALLRIR